MRAIAAREIASRTGPTVRRHTDSVESDAAVADDAVAVPGGVARVAKVEQARPQAAAPGGEQKPVHRRSATRLLVVDGDVEPQDRVYGLPVHLLRNRVRQVVGEIGAHDDQRLVPTPKALQHLGHLLRGCSANGERHHLEFLQHGLEERQMDLERMLMGMGVVAHHDLR